jgi:hypothetical protein
MHRHDRPQGRRPSIWTQRVISFLILFHLTSLFIALIWSIVGDRSIPRAVKRLTSPLRTYSRAVYMGGNYRFFAPTPPPSKKLYFRLVRHDGTVHWIDFPSRRSYETSTIYHRFWKIPQNGVKRVIGRNRRQRLLLTTDSQIVVASLVRYIGRPRGLPGERRHANPVDRLDVYEVDHQLMSIGQARKGWSTNDLRLFRFFHLGRYTVDGDRLDSGRVRRLTASAFVDDMLRNDLLPVLEHRPNREQFSVKLQVAHEIGIPDPILAFMANTPDILNGPPDQLATRIGRAIKDSRS